jgi:predicted RND superfamily exporter protein
MFQYFGTIAFISICLTYIITLVMLPYLLLLRDDPARLAWLKNAV